MKRLVTVILFIAMLAFVMTACNVIQKIVDPVKKEKKQIVVKRYDKDGLTFSFPDNWQVTEDTIIEKGIRHVNVEDSDSSLFILDIMSSELSIDLDEYADTFTKDLLANIPVGKISGVRNESSNRVIASQSREGVRRKYSVSALGEVVHHTIDFFLVEGENSRALLTIQAPDEDWNAAEKEFQIISDSLNF